MGHIINPYLYRLNVVYYWNSIFFINNFFFDYLTISSRYIYLFIKNYFREYKFQHYWKIYLYKIIFIQYYKNIYFYLCFSSFKYTLSELMNVYREHFFYFKKYLNFFFYFKFRNILINKFTFFFKYSHFKINKKNNNLLLNILNLKKNFLNYINFKNNNFFYLKKKFNKFNILNKLFNFKLNNNFFYKTYFKNFNINFSLFNDKYLNFFYFFNDHLIKLFKKYFINNFSKNMSKYINKYNFFNDFIFDFDKIYRFLNKKFIESKFNFLLIYYKNLYNFNTLYLSLRNKNFFKKRTISNVVFFLKNYLLKKFCIPMNEKYFKTNVLLYQYSYLDNYMHNYDILFFNKKKEIYDHIVNTEDKWDLLVIELRKEKERELKKSYYFYNFKINSKKSLKKFKKSYGSDLVYFRKILFLENIKKKSALRIKNFKFNFINLKRNIFNNFNFFFKKKNYLKKKRIYFKKEKIHLKSKFRVYRYISRKPLNIWYKNNFFLNKFILNKEFFFINSRKSYKDKKNLNELYEALILKKKNHFNFNNEYNKDLMDKNFKYRNILKNGRLPNPIMRDYFFPRFKFFFFRTSRKLHYRKHYNLIFKKFNFLNIFKKLNFLKFNFINYKNLYLNKIQIKKKIPIWNKIVHLNNFKGPARNFNINKKYSLTRIFNKVKLTDEIEKKLKKLKKLKKNKYKFSTYNNDLLIEPERFFWYFPNKFFFYRLNKIQNSLYKFYKPVIYNNYKNNLTSFNHLPISKLKKLIFFKDNYKNLSIKKSTSNSYKLKNKIEIFLYNYRTKNKLNKNNFYNKYVFLNKKIYKNKNFKNYLLDKKMFTLRSKLKLFYLLRVIKNLQIKFKNFNFNFLEDKNDIKLFLKKKFYQKYNLKKINSFFDIYLQYFLIVPEFMDLKNNVLSLLYIYYSKIKNISLVIFFKSTFFNVLTADLVCDYIILKLLQKFTLKELLWPLLRLFEKHILLNDFLGYRMLLMGRLTRKDRALFKWYKNGPLPLSTRISLIDYANRQVALKYSLCSMKIWLFKSIKYKKKKKISAIPIPLFK